MESLYRKYRPQTFDDVVGQQHVVETLTRAVADGRMSHAYLFCGPRGTGKTTMARLLAKALLCERGAGQLPDGTCEECRLVAEGAHPDVFELDAASRTGVDNVREEIINRVGYAAVRGAYKVYVIDEVHMLTNQSFNALLKTLEEPPSHVVFVLCTTDPQKIPATILSRVQRFEFHAISAADIEGRLKTVCEREGFQADPEALALIAQHARGGMRDALSTLEQLSVFGAGSITVAGAQDMLGEVASSTLGVVCDALARRDVATLFSEVASLVDSGRDLLRFVRELSARLRDIYICAAVGADARLLSPGAGSVEALAAEAAQFGSADRIARALTVLSDAASEMRYAPDQRLVLEVALTRLARPKTDLTLESLAERLAELERKVGSGLSVTPIAPVATTVQPPVPSSGGEDPRQARPVPAQGQASSRPALVPEPQPVPTPQPQPAPQAKLAPEPRPVPTPQPKPEKRPKADAPAAAAPAHVSAELEALWEKAVAQTIAAQPARGQLLSKGALVSDDGQTLTVSFPAGQSFALSMLKRRDVLDLVEPLLSKVFGQRRLCCVKEEGPAEAKPAAASAAPDTTQAKPRPKAAEPKATEPKVEAPVAHARPDMPQPQPDAPSQPEPPVDKGGEYPMPWDPYDAPGAALQDEVVPYEEEVVPYEDEYVPTEAYEDLPQVPPMEAAPAPEPAFEPKPSSASTPAPKAVSAPVPVPWPAPAPAAEAAPAPRPASEPEPADEPAPKAQPSSASPKPKASDGPSKQDREIESALTMLTDVFGPGITCERIPSSETDPEGQPDAEAMEIEEWDEPDGPFADGGFAEDMADGAYPIENYEE